MQKFEIRFPFYFSAKKYLDFLNLRETLRGLTGNDRIIYKVVECMEVDYPRHKVPSDGRLYHALFLVEE